MAISKLNISELLWDFRGDNRAIFINLVNSAMGQKTAIDGVVHFLAEWQKQDWFDQEKIALLGREIRDCTNAEFHIELDLAMKDAGILDAIIECFVVLEHAKNNMRHNVSLPSQTEFIKISTLIESAEEDTDLKKFEQIVDKYVSYFRNTGDYQSVGLSLNRLFWIGQQNSSIHYLNFHTILDRTIRQVFSIDATDERLWLNWAASFLKLGAFKASETVLWEAFRRRPDSTNIAFGLLKVFERTKYNYQNRIRFANMARKRLKFNRYIELEYARLNGYSNYSDQTLTGLDHLINLAANLDDIRYETVSLASIISNKWSELYNTDYLKKLLNNLHVKFKTKPKLIAAVAHKLGTDHGNIEAARVFFLDRISRSRSNKEKEILTNNLAKVIATQGKLENITEAIKLIENFKSVSSRNHTAKLLFARNKGDDWLIAEKILKENVKIDLNNYYSICQLANLIMHYGENRRLEALSLLEPHSDESEHVRELLMQIKTDSFARTDIAFVDTDENNSLEVEEHDPSGLKSLQTWRSGTLKNISVGEEISKSANYRKLKFEADYGTSASSERAIEFLATSERKAENSYVSFVCSLFGNGFEDDRDMGSVGAELTRAFEHNRLRELDLIAAEVPRLSVVVSLAKAGLNDTKSISEIDSLKEDFIEDLSWERTLVSNISSSRFGHRILEQQSDKDKEEATKRIGDVVGALISMETIAA